MCRGSDLRKLWWYLSLTIVTMSMCVRSRISCRNMEGRDVDWFVVIKLPASVDRWGGQGFVYFDSSQREWKPGHLPINSTSSAVGATLTQLYAVNNKTNFKIAYNDDWPNTHQANSGRGHSKGVAVADVGGGFWMLHSVPNFPPFGKYGYPETATKYAQSLLCLTFDADALPAISQYMRFAQVTPYINNLPPALKIIAPNLEDVVRKKSLARSATNFTFYRRIRTHGGMKVLVFSKHKKFNKDLWHDFIASTLRTPLAVETWRNGAAANVGTQCKSGVNVYDITQVTLPSAKFNSSRDHSKWGVSMNENVPVVCIGDVNRQVSQFRRGGGAACIQYKPLWKAFRDSVASFNGCNQIGCRISKVDKTPLSLLSSFRE